MAVDRSNLRFLGSFLLLTALGNLAAGQNGGNGGGGNTAARSTGNGLLGNPAGGTAAVLGGGGGNAAVLGGGGGSRSFSILGGTLGGTTTGSRIGPIPQEEVRTTQTFTAPQNGVVINGGGGNTIGNENGNSGNNNNGGNNNNEGRNRVLDSRGGYTYNNRYWWRGGYWDAGCYACGIWHSDTPGYPTCPACQYYDPNQRLCITVQDCPNT
ncbi:g5065 [Coccomyxa elongata]